MDATDNEVVQGLDVALAAEFKLALRRSGWTNRDLKSLCEGDILVRLLPVIRGFADVVAKTIVAKVFALWKTLTVGLDKSMDEVRAAFFKADMMHLSPLAADILSRVSLGASGEASVGFVRVKVKDLGFTKQAKWCEILAAGQKQGLELCLPEDGIALRLDYPEQLKGERVWLAANPVEGSDGYHHWFHLNRSTDGKWLDVLKLKSGISWDPEDEVVFRQAA